MNAPTKIIPNVGDLIGEYRTLRDNKAIAEKKAEKIIYENFTARMEEIAGTLLQHLDDMGTDSVSARGIGTAYRADKVSVTIQNQPEFKRWVIGGERWELIEWRVSKTAVNELVEQGELLPPGVDRSVKAAIGIRKD